MTALVRAELLKLCWTRATWAFAAAAVLLVALRVGLILAGVGTIGSAGRGSVDLTLAVLGASGSGVLVIALLGVVVVTREFHSATWTSTLLVTPNRARVLTAKFLAAGLTGVIVGILLLLVAAGLGVVFGQVRLTMSTALLQMVVGGLVYAAFWGSFGAAIGALIRNQTVALWCRRPGCCWSRPCCPRTDCTVSSRSPRPGSAPRSLEETCPVPFQHGPRCWCSSVTGSP